MKRIEVITNESRLEVYCYRTYLDFKNLEVLDFWNKNRTNTDAVRSITRPFYDLVHSLSVPSGFITERALEKKKEDPKWILCRDHCYSPQFIYQMLMDNHEIYVNNYDKYFNIFKTACTTIDILSEQNRSLSLLTSNHKGKYKVYVPTDKKYQYLDIKLVKRNYGRMWYKLPADSVSNYINTPQELLEYEKQFLAN
jgi:hypothetical protein